MKRGAETQEAVALFLNGLGDHFMTLPAIRATSAALKGDLTLVCLPGSAEMFFRELPVRRFVEVTRVEATNGYTFDSSSILQRIARCDLLLSFNRWFCPATERLLRHWQPSRSIGLFRDFKESVAFRHDVHASDLSFRVAQQIDAALRWDDFAAPPMINAEVEAQAEEFYSLLPSGMRVLALHAETGREKQWKPEYWRALLDQFLSRNKNFMVLPLGLDPLDLDRCRHRSRIIGAYGAPFHFALASLRRAHLFLGVDSCMLHAADAFGLPSVGLFGPTSAQEFGFHNTRKYRQFQGNGSLDGIMPRAVLGALEELIA